MPKRIEVTEKDYKASDQEAMLEKFLLDLNIDYDATQDQREAADADCRFINVVGGQWEDYLDTNYENRTKLEFDMVSDYRNKFVGEWTTNPVGVEYKPDDSATSDDDAELLNGVRRADFRDRFGEMATNNAVEEVATCGAGGYKISAVFESPGDPENDNQVIEYRPIHNAYESICWDAGSKRIDKVDARHVTELTAYTKESFKAEFGDIDAVSAINPTRAWARGAGIHTPEQIFVATRYHVENNKIKVFVYENLRDGKIESYDAEAHKEMEEELRKSEFHNFKRERKVIKRSIFKTVFSGADIIEKPERIAGEWLPIVPFYGYRAWVGGSEWYRGLVRKLIDPARLFNQQMSQLAENSASAGQEVPIFTPDQIQGFEHFWADKNNKPYMLINPTVDVSGRTIAAGPVGYLKPPQLDANTTAILGTVPQFIQNVTGGVPQDTLDPDASGKAINALIKRSNLNTKVVMDNIANAIEWGGTVYQSIAAEVYDGPRMMKIIGKDGNQTKAQLHQPEFNEDSGRLVESNVLSGKKFKAYADKSGAYESQRDQTVEEMKGMITAVNGVPGSEKFIPTMMGTMFENISGSGLDALKRIVRNDNIASGVIKPETPEEQQIWEQAQQPREDPQKKLMEAAAQQQLAEARSLDASSQQKVADSQKKNAETAQIISSIELDKAKLLIEVRDRTLNRVKELPIGQR
jgi:hypothetical protein